MIALAAALQRSIDLAAQGSGTAEQIKIISNQRLLLVCRGQRLTGR